MNKRCAFDCGDKCYALTVRECKGCSFYKTKEELREGRDQAEARVLRLDPDLKMYIRYKYYGGQRKYGI